MSEDDKPLFSLNLDHPDGPQLSILKSSDMPPAERAAFERLKADPEYQKRMQRFHEVVSRGAPPLAVLEEDLPEGAAAQIIVDPKADRPRFIVVSPSLFDDKILELSQHHLKSFEMSAPDNHGRAVLTLWPDETLRLEFNKGTRQFKPDVKMFNFQDRGYAQKVLARARKRPVADLKGLGKARVVELKGTRGEEP